MWGIKFEEVVREVEGLKALARSYKQHVGKAFGDRSKEVNEYAHLE